VRQELAVHVIDCLGGPAPLRLSHCHVVAQRRRDLFCFGVVRTELGFTAEKKHKKHLKMLGPFATASRRTPPVLHCHSPGVATVTRRLRIAVHNNDDNDNA